MTDPTPPLRTARVHGSSFPVGWLGLVALAAVAAAVRTQSWLRAGALFDDGPTFIALARALAAGDWRAALGHPYHPLYPALVAGLSRCGVGFEAAAAAISIAAGVLSVVAFALWLDDAFDRRTAAAGGALLALHPFAVSFSADVQSDGLYLALFLFGILFLWRTFRTGRVSDAALAGGFSGLAYLTRPEGLGIAVLGAAAVLAAWRWGRVSPRRVAAALAVLIVTAGVPTAAYVAALHAQTGTWQLTQKKSLIRLAQAEAQSAPAVESPLASPPVLPRSDDRPPPRGARARLAAAAWDLYSSTISVFRFELLPFLLIGLAAARGRPGLRGIFVGGVAGAYAVVLIALVLSAGYVSRRHALPPLLPVMGYAASGLALSASAAAGWLAARWDAGSRATAWIAGAGVALVLVAMWGALDLTPRRLDRVAERQAAEWLRGAGLAPGAVAAGRPRVAYYAERAFVALPSDPSGGMMAYLRSRGARYVVVDESNLDLHGGLREARGNGLRLIHRERSGGRTAAVFEVVPEPESPPPPGG